MEFYRMRSMYRIPRRLVMNGDNIKKKPNEIHRAFGRTANIIARETDFIYVK
jgi:hypothetical protein